MFGKLILISIAVVSIILTGGCGVQKKGHEGHEHAGHEESGHAGEGSGARAEEDSDVHSGETHTAHAGEASDAHAGEGEVELTAEMVKMAGITLATAGTGSISISLDLSGEVGFNEDRLVHITPRFPGIAKEARCRLGDFVNAGAVVAVIESNESMTPYSLKAPLSGRIIEKHITPGEYVSETESIYLLADLSTVWVNLAVYPQDAATVTTGLKVSIAAVGSDQAAEGTIGYVNPVMDVQTRRVTARVILANGGNRWRPGTFVNARVQVGEGEKGVVVEKEAVQLLNGETVVFVQDEPNTFKPVDVTVGESDSRHIRVLGGLESGAEYVATGAFELKAKIVTSSLGGHAGHGH
jgi:cobalt-zinc-cadmium efflux system membrane fusion protein